MENLINDYSLYLKSKKLSVNTINAYITDIKFFLDFLFKEEIEINELDQITLYSYCQQEKEQQKTNTSINRKISSIKSFYRYLHLNNLIENNPIVGFTYNQGKHEDFYPTYLTVEEINRLLACPDENIAQGLRDKTILELMYATGIKVTELINLKIDNINIRFSYIICRDSTKERSIPLGSYALRCIEKYLKHRKELSLDNEYLFLNNRGLKLSRQSIWKIINKYASESGIKKQVNPYVIRHSFAIHLLQNGADLKAVQELLGHNSLNITQVYYKYIKRNKLMEVYKNFHPRA